MITEDYVSFETAKLLKEKGFDEPCTYLWFFEKTNNPEVDDNGVYKIPIKNHTENDYWNNTSIELFKKESEYWNDDIDIFACPTLQMATKWLRKNFNMNPVPYATSIGGDFEGFDLAQRDITGCALLYQVGIPSKEKTFETCEEACEAGIRYCLENLI